MYRCYLHATCRRPGFVPTSKFNQVLIPCLGFSFHNRATKLWFYNLSHRVISAPGGCGLLGPGGLSLPSFLSGYREEPPKALSTKHEYPWLAHALRIQNWGADWGTCRSYGTRTPPALAPEEEARAPEHHGDKLMSRVKAP